MTDLHTTDSDIVKAAHSATAESAVDESHSTRVFRYTSEQLQSIPVESHMGLSGGNPLIAANIKKGENVLDLWSGGIDVLLAASKVGPTGQAIGLDMSLDIVSRARDNARKQGLFPPQVAFIQASLTDPLPISTDSIDCIISNCVINLLPFAGKKLILKEAYRVLKAGGRIILADIVVKKALPEAFRHDLASRVDCIAGAVDIDSYKNLLADAGFIDAVFTDTVADLYVYGKSDTLSAGVYHSADLPGGETCAKPSCRLGEIASNCPSAPIEYSRTDFDLNLYTASYQIHACKPIDPNAPTSEGPSALLRWWDAYPTIQSSPLPISNDEVAALIKDSDCGRSEYAVIDVRRNDHAGGHVRGSIQWPAQTFHNDLSSFLEMFGETQKVVFYCSSSKGRGPRCAGWYQDYLNDKGKTTSKAYVLQGGIKAWLHKFGDDVELVDKD